MDNKRILTIQDVSCVGQCSLTVALPILSACGIETAVLPSAVLSNHTAFDEFTFCDLTSEMPKIRESWERQGLGFSALYTGYLGNAKQVKLVKDIIKSNIDPEGVKIIDPAMADSGRLYTGFDESFAKEMVSLADFEKSMEGIYTTSVNQSTVDESPMVYKPMDEIVENIKNTVDILKIVKPIYNFKASE